jgi:pimeloyl-ACP methyl ester carboxylesterase
MAQDTITGTKTYTLEVPGAVITYDVRRNASGAAPALMLIGSPMGAAGFGSLASHFTDRMVITYDPRGSERSTKSDPSSESTPEQHADDLHRVIAAIGAGPVDLFASSGGAVNALALVTSHPEDLRTVVAHEPPALGVLPDREHALAAARDMNETYKRHGLGPGMAKFIAFVMEKGPITAEYASRPAPDPAAFGLPTEDDGSRDDVLLAQNMISCTHYQVDFAALKKASARIVLAAGVESEGEAANRAAHVIAQRLGMPIEIFPSHHGGFAGGEYGQTGQPEAFAAHLREVLNR